MASQRPEPPDPYKSVLDLPSVAEMVQFIRGAKMLTLFVARDQRREIRRAEAELKDLAQLVEDFYSLLGPRHWIFHESLNAEKVKEIVKLPADEAERALIEIYKDPEALGFMILRLKHHPEMLARLGLIERAQQDYAAGRYYSAVLVLLAVLDGFVNDIETQHRRGLHTRTEDEMVAWDSIVGHHQGLTNAHKTFTKRFFKTSDEEVFELYRNGIVHGVLLNFDNDVVATKAWNRLFAVADWADARQKQTIPKEPEPTWGELWQQIRKNEATKTALDEWQPRVVEESDPNFTEDPLYLLAAEYLSAWQRANFGRMGQLISSRVREDTPGKTAGRVREMFEGFTLSDFTVSRINYKAAALCEVDVTLALDGETRPGLMRWIREASDGMSAMPNDPGEWLLASWGPWTIIKNVGD